MMHSNDAHPLIGVILAAGLGTRLFPITAHLPKAAIRVGSTPLLWHITRQLLRLQLARTFITLHHAPQVILDLDLPGRMGLQPEVETQLLGTGGGIAQIFRRSNGSALLICPSDTLFDFNLDHAIHIHRDSSALATLCLTTIPYPEQYSIVRIDSYSRIRQVGPLFKALSEANEDPTPYTFTGICIVERKLFEPLMTRTEIDFVMDVLLPALQDDPSQVIGVPLEGFWADLGTPTSYIAGVLAYESMRCGKDVDFAVGRGTRIHHNAQVAGSLIWDYCTISDSCAITNCIVMDCVMLPSRSCISDSIILRWSSPDFPDDRADVISRAGVDWIIAVPFA